MPSRDELERDHRKVVLVRTALVLLTLLALFLRVAYLRTTEVDTPLRADAREYALYASNLVQHGVYSKQVSASPAPDAFRSPGFPLLAAAVLALSGPQRMLDGVLWLQSLLGAAMVPLAFALGRRCMPAIAALGAAACVAFSPHLITAGGYFLSEALYAFFLLAAITVSCIALESHRKWIASAAGALFGCAWAINETALFYPLILVLVALFWPGGGWRAAWRHAGRPAALCLLLVFAIFPLAWSVRNASVLDAGAARGSDRALATLTHGTYPDFCYGGDPSTRPYPYRYDPEQPRYASSWSEFSRIFGTRVAAEPMQYARWFFLGKPATLWSWSILQGEGDVYVYPVHTSLYRQYELAELTRRTMQWLHLPMVAIAALGFFMRLVRRMRGHGLEADGAVLCGALCVSATLLFTVFAPWPRYAVPLRPELYLVAFSATAAALRFCVPKQRQTADPLNNMERIANVP